MRRSELQVRSQSDSIPSSDSKTQADSNSKKAIPDEEFGEWMVVRRSGRNAGVRNRATAEIRSGAAEHFFRGKKTYSNSRFDVLASDDVKEAANVRKSDPPSTKKQAVRLNLNRNSQTISVPNVPIKKEGRRRVKPGDKRGRTTDSEGSDQAAETNRVEDYEKPREKKHESSQNGNSGSMTVGSKLDKQLPLTVGLTLDGPLAFKMDQQNEDKAKSGPSMSKGRIHRVLRGSIINSTTILFREKVRSRFNPRN